MAAVRQTLTLRLPFRPRGEPVLCAVLLAAVGFVVLSPLGLLLLNSFKLAHPDGSTTVGLDHWKRALAEPAMLAAVFNTARLAVVLQIISVPVALPVAWLLARTDLPGRSWIEFLFWVAFFAPVLPITLGWILLLDPDFGLFNHVAVAVFGMDRGPFDIYSFWGIVWVHLATKTIVSKVILLTPLFRNLDASLEEASRVAGVGQVRTLLRIVMPVMAPAILVVLVVSIIHLLETFEIEQVLGPPFGFYVYSTLIYQQLQLQPPEYGAATVLAAMILVAMSPLIVAQHLVSRSRRYTTVGGQYRSQPFVLGSWKWPAFGLVLGMGVFLTVLPVFFLGLTTCMRLFGFFTLPDPWTLEHWRRVLNDPIFLRSFGNTLVLGGGTALLAVVCYPAIAYAAVRTRFGGRHVLDFLSWLPVAVPGIILGLGFLWFFLGTPVFRPLYGTVAVLILATTITSMTLGVQLLKSSLLQLGDELEEASRVAGASWFHTFRRVILPIQAPVLVTVGTVAFIAAARNVAGVALLVTSRNRPLAMLQLDYMVDGRYEAAAVVGMIVMLLTSGVALVARGLGQRIGIHT
jgi:iron(III) transport system permease protein